MPPPAPQSPISRHAPGGQRSLLGPLERISGIVYGVLMAVSITGTFSVAGDGGDQEAWTLARAALGCNLAWGITDAVVYLIGIVTERERSASLLRRLHAASELSEAHGLIADALPDTIATVASADTLEALRLGLLSLPAPGPRLRLHDLAAALGVFAVVVVSTFPVALPLLLIDEPRLALRISNLTALATLFAAGTLLGRYAGSSRLRHGLVLAALGAALVLVIIALGG